VRLERHVNPPPPSRSSPTLYQYRILTRSAYCFTLKMEVANSSETLVSTRLYVVTSQKPLLFSKVIGYGLGVASPAREIIFFSPSRLALGLGLLSDKYGRNVKRNIRLHLETRLRIGTSFSVARIGPEFSSQLPLPSSSRSDCLQMCKF
jgi:hypothetical protein